MDQITNNLNNQTGKAYHPSLMAAMKLTRKKMDHYYSLTDSSNIYRIAMVLHPGMKLEYFHNQKWEHEWIEQADTLVRREYVAKYEKAVDESNMAPSNKSNTDDRFTSFSNLSVTTCPHASEIQKYLCLPVKNIKEPLKWWIDNKHIYLNLHHMALDYLSIPGKSSHLFY
jgi:hAT family C-terminal dimerisation region